MARHESVVLVDDLSGEEGEGVRTREFGIDGKIFEIDLDEANSNELDDALAVFIEHARRVGGRVKRPTAAKASGSGYGKDTLKAIREWAKREGMDVSDRGRLPGNVVEAWEQAHQGSAA